MLPSTGYFKALNCPFYNSGLCERPYCHFRHVKRDSQNLSSDGIESGAMLQKLVSEAVKKVLEHTENTGGTQSTPAADAASSVSIANTDPSLTLQKATYNPTPIAELKKINNTDIENSEESTEQRRRHIPVPYTPRKPSNLPSKRPIDSNNDGECKPFVYVPPPLKYLPGSADSIPLDIYTPQGALETNEKYLPGSEQELQEYKPLETKTSSNVNYVPSDKSASKKQVLEYKPTKVSSKSNAPRAIYQPTPRSQVPCFSSDEDEPESKKKKTSDLNGLDDLGAEFDILGQILDEEKPADAKVKDKKEVKLTENGISQPHKKSDKSINKDDKKKLDSKERDQKDKKCDKKNYDKKSDDKKFNDKKSDDKKSSDRKPSLKSSSKDREKEKNKERDKGKDKQREKNKEREKEKLRDKDKIKEKESSDKNRSSSSKSSERQSKNSEISSKHSDKLSKSSSKNENDKKREKDEKTKHKSSKEKRSKDKKESKTKDKKVVKNISDDEINADDSIQLGDELCEEISDSDEEAIALECKRIFEEYVPSEKPRILEEISQENSTEEEYIPTKKRISHTADKDIKIIRKESIKPDYKVSAAQKMAERLAKVREYHAAKAALAAESVPVRPEQPKVMFSQPATPSSNKIRIAHVPYASTMMNAKRTIPPPSAVKETEPSTSTAIQTVKRGTQRVAHMPNEKFIDRPGVLEPLASKIPANIRSTYLNMMIDECLKIYITTTDAYARAQHEELNTSKKCKTIQIYKNSAVLTVSRLRKECQECKGVKKSGLDCTALQKVSGTVTGTTGNAGSWSIENKNRRGFENPNEYKGAKLYENIQKWVLTEEQVRENGYPRPHPSGERGRATIYSQNNGKPPKGFIRNCCRCKQDFTVDKKGFSLVKEECVYHPNRKYRFRGEVKYQCCSQDGMSDGCCVAPCHVYEYVDYENLRGFVTTMAPERVMDDYGVYSLDCEMCYTTHGLDLTRITVIDSACKVVYETLIRPLHPIVDYNTRYSGITEEHMTDVKTTLLEVQATLLSMFNSKTILVGHSLESDFKALKLIHDTVIDTSVLFPHKMGPPYKRALRNLSSEYLKKIIQNSVEGHDSAEDATVCMELIHFKLKEDLKTR